MGVSLVAVTMRGNGITEAQLMKEVGQLLELSRFAVATVLGAELIYHRYIGTMHRSKPNKQYGLY
jgi:hypothetical protein